MLKVDELVMDLERRLRNHNIVTPPNVNQRPPDTTMSQSEIILKVISKTIILYFRKAFKLLFCCSDAAYLLHNYVITMSDTRTTVVIFVNSRSKNT